ncbi:MAG: histidinol-phosphatase [Clostridia bacterium]|nr:histidinol-phosphatase [Clostridia bacterium]
MIANYHTHTWRCGHATGTEEEYVQNAISRGLKTLGFSDHSPYVFPEGYYSNFRMKPEQTAEYAAVINDLRDRYSNVIDIHLGVELEYYPDCFADTISHLKGHGVEYAILGAHFMGNEIGEIPSIKQTDDEQRLIRYCRQCMEAMETGCFTYIAHPDLINFTGDPSIYDKHMRQFCRKANECGVPLEINLLGLEEGRNYPNPLFWKIAAEEGCQTVLGCDAHRADALLDIATEQKARKFAEECGIIISETVELKKL